MALRCQEAWAMKIRCLAASGMTRKLAVGTAPGPQMSQGLPKLAMSHEAVYTWYIKLSTQSVPIHQKGLCCFTWLIFTPQPVTRFWPPAPRDSDREKSPYRMNLMCSSTYQHVVQLCEIGRIHKRNKHAPETGVFDTDFLICCRVASACMRTM